ncbi:hypothetical protein Cgig2_002670 [Carnegiea gigantea]|uniref:Uncharacterized protein n=1 Tax=Carnegiea gigantea TaxID=171969 RepID=A0A9Q1K2T2_9CARY|nr:hypothetical protein Cgig2_002670 [Carnegiea gigantea]
MVDEKLYVYHDGRHHLPGFRTGQKSYGGGLVGQAASPLRLHTYPRRRALPPTGADTISSLHRAGARSIPVKLKRSTLYGAARSTHDSKTQWPPHARANSQFNDCFHTLCNPFQADCLSRHTTTECRELKKAHYELADKGQIDQFLKRGPRFLRREHEPAQPQPRNEECSIEAMATIAGGYTEGITRAQQVLTTEQGPRGMVPTMVFSRNEAPRFASPIMTPYAIVRRILVDTGSSVDIITWGCLKKLTHPGLDIVCLVHPTLGFYG